MPGKVIVLLLLVSAFCSIGGNQFPVLQQFSRLAASTAVLLPSSNVSQACVQQVASVLREAEGLHLWALKVIDATAKVPSGILHGNINQLGDFDLCLEAAGNGENAEIRGRYCLADFDIVPKDENLKEIDDITHSFRPLTSNIDDPAQRVPKFSSWRWGVCMPSACTPEDLNNHLQQILSQTFAHAAHVSVRVDPDACYTNHKASLSFGHYFTMSLFLLLITCLAYGTIQERMNLKLQKTKLGKLLQCFSLQRNWAKLINTEAEGEDIEIVNGARGLNALPLLMAHKQMAYLFTPFANSHKMAQNVTGEWSMIARSSYLYTESFVLLSGFLVAHSTIKELDKTGKINIGRNFISRYISFTPNLLVVILTNTYLMELVGSGPMWGIVVDKYSKLCKKHMWRNLLYIHNYNGWENMCLTNTHQLAVDMQLYLVSPIFIYLLWKSPKLGVLFIAIVSAVSSWLRYTAIVEHGINYVVHYGASIQQLFSTGTVSYSLATHRATVYCIGILFGYALRRGYTQINISSTAATAGWSAATAAALVAVFGAADMGTRDYVYDRYQSATSGTFAAILWSFFLVWAGIACWNNRGGWMNDLLTWKYFRVFSRISYAFYLVQFPLFFYNVGVLRSSQTYNSLAIIDMKDISSVFATAILLTLTVDMPCQNLKRLFFARASGSQSSPIKDKNDNIAVPYKEKNGHR